MIVITTINSTKLKPAPRPERPPITIPNKASHPGLIARLTVNVKHVLAAPAGGLGVVLVAAHAPFVLARERVPRDAAQEPHLLAVRRCWQFHALHQDFQRLRLVVRCPVSADRRSRHRNSPCICRWRAASRPGRRAVPARRSARTRERASGTAMVVRISMIVKATISSTSVSPRCFLRRMFHPTGY